MDCPKKIFLQITRTLFFRNTGECVAIHLFFLDCKVSNKNLTFCFFASSKIQALCTNFLLPVTWNFSNYSRSFPQLISSSFSEHWSSFQEVFHKSSCSAKWCDETQLFCTSGQNQESVTCKFTKNWTLSQVFFKELNLIFRTALLINTSWWLLLFYNHF